MAPVTAQEVMVRCPMIYIECYGIRQLARTENVGDRCRIHITDAETLVRIDPDDVFEATWQEVADAMNDGRPLFVK